MSSKTQAIPSKSVEEQLSELERVLESSVSPESACSKLAQFLRVARSEIALLRLEKGRLRFIYPPELSAAGTIPLSGSAVAARTAVTHTSLLSNSFARVRHVSVFETVKLHDDEASEDTNPMPIQKIISVPMMTADGKVTGVIQISRRGLDSALAGADFTTEDLRLVEKAAQTLAAMAFMHQDATQVSQESHSRIEDEEITKP